MPALKTEHTTKIGETNFTIRYVLYLHDNGPKVKARPKRFGDERLSADLQEIELGDVPHLVRIHFFDKLTEARNAFEPEEGAIHG